jgi:hypothetical protein
LDPFPLDNTAPRGLPAPSISPYERGNIVDNIKRPAALAANADDE